MCLHIVCFKIQKNHCKNWRQCLCHRHNNLITGLNEKDGRTLLNDPPSASLPPIGIETQNVAAVWLKINLEDQVYNLSMQNNAQQSIFDITML